MIDFYTNITSNGQKISIMLEECELEYRAFPINVGAKENLTDAFLKINPAGKIPAIVDYDGPDGRPITVAQSLAIILYLAEKTGRFMPANLRERAEAYRYLAAVASDVNTALAEFSGSVPTRPIPNFLRLTAPWRSVKCVYSIKD